jgi:hypothetical protein
VCSRCSCCSALRRCCAAASGSSAAVLQRCDGVAAARLSLSALSKLSAAVLTWLRLVQLLRTYQSSDEHRTNVRNSMANCVMTLNLTLSSRLLVRVRFGFCPQRSPGRKRPGEACGTAQRHMGALDDSVRAQPQEPWWLLAAALRRPGRACPRPRARPATTLLNRGQPSKQRPRHRCRACGGTALTAE